MLYRNYFQIIILYTSVINEHFVYIVAKAERNNLTTHMSIKILSKMEIGQHYGLTEFC